MINALLASFALVGSFSTAFAAELPHSEIVRLVNNMTLACAVELRADPALAPSLANDREAIWQNLEDKEKLSKLSKECDAAEDAYEEVFHHDIWQAEQAAEAAARQNK
jgi:hypothetical protein